MQTDNQKQELQHGAAGRNAVDDADEEDAAPAPKRKARGAAAAAIRAGAAVAKAVTQRTRGATTKRRRGATDASASDATEQSENDAEPEADASPASRPKRRRNSAAASTAPAVEPPAAHTGAQRFSQRSTSIRGRSTDANPVPVCPADARQVAVIFTGFDSKGKKLQDLETVVNELGGQVTKSADECTHVVFESNKIAKTEKSLVAISRGCMFTTTKWLTESKKAKRWQDSTKFIVRDRSLERELGFELPVSIGRAQHSDDAGSKLLEGKEVFALKGVGRGNHDAVCHIVEAAGAQFCKRALGKRRNSSRDDTILVIAEPQADAVEIGRLKAAGHLIYDWKAVSGSLLAQERRFTADFEL
jgi:hypothetical protein